MQATSFSDSMAALLKEAGLGDAVLVLSRPEDVDHFGNAMAVFRIGSVLFRFESDRSWLKLELAAVHSPEQFHRSGDVEVAFGWRQVDDLLQEPLEPRPLDPILERLAPHMPALQAAFSQEYEATNLKVNATGDERARRQEEEDSRKYGYSSPQYRSGA